MKQQSKTTHTFTLTELIIVIGLIGLFLGVAMPAFTNVSKGRSNSAACTDIAGQLSIARSYSIQNHCYTALVFPSQDELDDGLDGAPTKNEILTNISKFYDASVRIAIVTPTYNSNGGISGYHFVMWMPGTNWVTFSNNVRIADNKTFPSSYDQDLEGVILDVDLLRMGGKDTNKTYTMDVEKYIVIKPNGEVVKGNNSEMIIAVTDGFFDIRKKKMVYEKRLKKGTEQYYHGLGIWTLTGRSEQGEYEIVKKKFKGISD